MGISMKIRNPLWQSTATGEGGLYGIPVLRVQSFFDAQALLPGAPACPFEKTRHFEKTRGTVKFALEYGRASAYTDSPRL